MKMGLLEIDPNNPQAAAQQRALLALASGLLSTPGSFGRGIGASLPGLLSAYDSTMQQARQSKLQDAQLQQAQLGLQSGRLGLSREQISLEQAREAQARQKQMQGLAQQFARTPQQQAMSVNGGPTVAAANAAQTTAPGFDFAGYANALAGIDPAASLGMQAALRKDDAPIALGDGGMLVTRDGRKLAENTKTAPTSDIGKLIGEMQALPQGHPMRPVYADAIRKATTHQPAASTNVSVNTGQKGFDNTLKLRGDFRSEPTYKAFQEVQAAYQQIQQGLAMASPAGDLASATKIMKLLDPGSVVRESELGMAMAATGMLDRVSNYATNIMQGTKLTPSQRQDFGRLGQALYGEAVKQYNAKRAEYQGIADRNGLSVPDVLGTAPSVPVSGDTRPGGRVVDFGSLK